MSKGFSVAQKGHVVNILPPVNVTGGAISQAVCMKDAGMISIVVQLGVQADPLTSITLTAGTATAAVGTASAGAAAIPFNYWAQTTAGAANDTLGTIQAATASGITAPSGNNGIFYVLEVNADDLPAGSDYVQLVLAAPADSIIASAVAILSGLRYAGEQNPTATL
jgi:hypothetical protein